ncbi:Hypothetical protein FKW44_008099, partial [Caligus rogercresseyi]
FIQSPNPSPMALQVAPRTILVFLDFNKASQILRGTILSLLGIHLPPMEAEVPRIIIMPYWTFKIIVL